MKLTTEYREESTGVLTGQKHHYLVCTVAFSEEEKAILQQRGLYDLTLEVPAAAPSPTKVDGVINMLLVWGGLVPAVIGLLGVIVQLIKPSAMGGAGLTPLLMLVIGGGASIYGFYKHWEANKYAKHQKLTARKLLTNPTFLVHAYTAEGARHFEADVRDALATFATLIRENAVVPEQNVYDL